MYPFAPAASAPSAGRRERAVLVKWLPRPIVTAGAKPVKLEGDGEKSTTGPASMPAAAAQPERSAVTGAGSRISPGPIVPSPQFTSPGICDGAAARSSSVGNSVASVAVGLLESVELSGGVATASVSCAPSTTVCRNSNESRAA